MYPLLEGSLRAPRPVFSAPAMPVECQLCHGLYLAFHAYLWERSQTLPQAPPRPHQPAGPGKRAAAASRQPA